jgi:hypothetical protein
MKKTAISSILAALALTGCEPPPNETTMEVVIGKSERFRVEQVGSFDDSLAYHWRRGIYVITDTQTGREYVGVSGVGISEVGQHGDGGKFNSTSTDER